MSDLSKRLAALPPEKRALLSRQLKNKTESPRGPAVPRRPPNVAVPLSFAQQRLWFLDQLEPDSPLYNVPTNVRLTGKLDAEVLRRSLNEIVRRHEVLRTTFTPQSQDGRAVQVIAPALSLALPVVDLQDLPRAEQDAAVERHALAEARHVFALQKGPLVRATLLRLAEREHVLLLNMHHIISDGWSMGVMLQEMGTLYASLAAGRASVLPELPVQYADYSVWQREWLSGEEYAKQAAYWKARLSGSLPVLELPTDRPRPAVQSFRGAHHLFHLDAPLTTALKDVSRQEGVTLFMTMLAAFKLLLHRYNGQVDLLVGTPIANRTQPELEGLIGYFANTLVLRTSLDGDPSFRAFLKQVEDVCLGAYAHQDLPFDQLVELIQPERSLSHMPLFQVMFVFRNDPSKPLALPELTMAPMEVESGTSKFDLTLYLMEVEGRLQVSLEYSTDLFDAATIHRMEGHFRTLLASLAADPGQRLSRVPLLTAPEQQQLLRDWNATDLAFPERACLHELFEAWVDRAPDAVAAVCGEEALSYRELNRRANQLAHRLRALGVGPNVKVGICVRRSLDAVVGLMGIVKAGGAYMPLDPAYPKERLQFMLEDVQAPVLLTQSPLLERLPAQRSRVLCLDTDWAEIAREPDTNPAHVATPEDLVYVIYTSGSTGNPKGVMLDHRGRVNNFTDFNRRFQVGPGDAVLALSSLSFDMSAYDVFGTLAAGSTIVLPVAALERDPAHWAQLMVQHRVSVWHSVPALLEMLLASVGTDGERVPRWLRLVLLGGDWIPVSLPDRLKAVVAGARVISLGGATEISMDSTIYDVVETDPAWKSIPYGMPMTNQLCYVLDAQLQPVPIGVPGELHLGGVGVAWGYLNRPELTATKFIPHPFSTRPGGRLYKTGDLARYRPDGNLELLGRIDNQVKINGLRIELGEIEAALRKLPGVDEVIVVARAEGSGPKRLVAYVVPDAGQALTAEDVRAALKAQIPEYMVPTAYVFLEALPLTPNGKVDRRNLPAPQLIRQDAQPVVAPRTPEEKVLAGIWSALLGVEQLSVHDNFFSLGGDSVLGVQLVARARQAGLHLTPKQLFQHQTLAALAEVVEPVAARPAEEASGPRLTARQQQVADRMRAEDASIEALYPVSPMQRNMLTRDRGPHAPGLYVVHASMQLPGDLHVERFREAWQRVLAHHPVLRTGFVWEGLDEPLQVVRRAVDVPLEAHDWRHLSLDAQREQLAALLLADRRRGFELSQAPLMRLLLIHVDASTYYFTWSNHHALLDGWSRAIVLKDVFLTYRALLANEAPPLQARRSYADYIGWIQQKDAAASEQFWRQQLSGFSGPEPLVLGPAPAPLALQEDRFDKQSLTLSAATTAALQAMGRQHQLTVNTLVQGAWVLLQHHHGQGGKDVVIGVTSSGRPTDMADVETVVGLCMNTLPLRIQVDPGTLLVPWLKELQTRQVDARQHEYTPLPRIQQLAGMSPDTVPFESIIVFENYPVDPALLEVGKGWVGKHPLARENYDVAQTEFPLRVEVIPGAELQLVLSYYRSRHGAEAITRLLEEFQALLEGMIAGPEQPLRSLVQRHL
ncbi:hypothetical protein KH5H1_74190 [Corallococcus caeni]|uniref:amino acid adenylation domain-containing protein n=1 Tax=Corallococcus caeni TaxID=3082388 RepID=UPI0029562775|nr:hypothetical protein KH5H1_74190 [Corallococcus sp. KH5-1]